MTDATSPAAKAAIEEELEQERELSGTNAEPEAEAVEDEYAVVEVFGHRRHYGRVLEVERFGAKLLRVDIPTDGDFTKGYTSHLYGGAAIFSFTPSDRATVERCNRPYHAARPLIARPEDDPYVDAPGDDDLEDASEYLA